MSSAQSEENFTLDDSLIKPNSGFSSDYFLLLIGIILLIAVTAKISRTAKDVIVVFGVMSSLFIVCKKIISFASD